MEVTGLRVMESKHSRGGLAAVQYLLVYRRLARARAPRRRVRARQRTRRLAQRRRQGKEIHRPGIRLY